MRVLPVAAALALSLVFTVGGVAIKGRADSPDRTPAPGASQTTPAHAPLVSTRPQVCRMVEHPARPPMHLERVARRSDFIPLNTRGYNYALPGELQFDPTGRAQPGAGAQPPVQTPVPAAPAKP